MTQLETQLGSYADSVAFRLTRLAAGDREQAQDSLWLAMQGDPILRRAVERAGVQKLCLGHSHSQPDRRGSSCAPRT